MADLTLPHIETTMHRRIVFFGIPTSLAVALTLLLSARLPLLRSALESNLGFVDLNRNSLMQMADPTMWLASCDQLIASATAEAHFKRAVQWNSQNGRALVGLGMSEWLSGKCKSASTKWRRAVESDPESERLWFYAGYGYLALGDSEHAVEAFRRAGAWRYLHNQGWRDQQRGDLESALARYELAATVNPNSRTISSVTQLYDHYGRKADAIAAWRRLAAQTTVESSEHWLAVGEAASLEGNWDKAIAAYRRGAELAPDPYSFYERIGHALDRKGDWNGALEAYQQAVRLRPDSIYAYVYAGRMMQKLDRNDEARSWYLQAEATNPESDLPKQQLGMLALQEGNYATPTDKAICTERSRTSSKL